MIDDYPVAKIEIHRAVRLVTTARLRSPVLAPLVPPGELDTLAEIEGATSERLVKQQVGATGIDPREFVTNVPMATFINASFAYPRPGVLNRFNGPDRGAWYAAIELETAIAEVAYHLIRELDAVGDYSTSVDYAELCSSFIGDFLDLRGILGASPDCLSQNPDVAYPHGNAVALSARTAGHSGIVYPSARKPGGTCLVALTPHAVQSVKQGQVIRLQWTGNRDPEVIYDFKG